MVYRIAADFVALLHIFFVLFVIFGAALVWRWPRLAFGHIPVFIWGGCIEIGGWICPLTHLENYLQRLGMESGYKNSFLENYILPLIYPDLWFPGGFPRGGFIFIGVLVLLGNVSVYFFLWRKHRTL